MTKGPIAFEFRSSRVTKVLALIQKLQQKLVTVQLCPMLRCLRTNNSTQSLRIFGIGSNTPRKLENFISLSDQVVRQCVASNFGENSTPDISSHFTANEDRSIVACLSVFFCDEELGSADGERNIHCCFSVYSPNLDRLALFEEQLGYLNRYERLIYQAFDVKFNGNSNLVAIGVNLISSFGIDEQRTRFELNCPLDITEAQASGTGSQTRPPSPIGRLLRNHQRRQKVFRITKLSKISKAQAPATINATDPCLHSSQRLQWT